MIRRVSFEFIKTKYRELKIQLKTARGELPSSGEEMSKIRNEYFFVILIYLFIIIFTQENKYIVPRIQEVFRGDDGKLIDILLQIKNNEQESNFVYDVACTC